MPSFHGADAIPETLEKVVEAFELFNLTGEVLIVNDECTVETELAIRELRAPFPIRTLKKTPNMGVGQSIQAGFKVLINEARMDDALVVMSADNRHNPMLIFRMFLQIMEGSDVVIASRFENGSRTPGMTAHRKGISWLTNTYYRLRYPDLGRLDFTGAFRAYRAEFIRYALDHYGEQFVEKDGPESLAEILIKLKRFYPIIHQLPSISRYDRTISNPSQTERRSATRSGYNPNNWLAAS